jgi:hypothetical protein
MRPGVLSLAFLLTAAVPLSAQQSLTLAAGPNEREPLPLVQHALNAAALRPSYSVRLVSDWPQLSGGDLGCLNGGQEVLEGILTQDSEGGYTGSLVRKGTIRFCGIHGSAQTACALTLTSAGTVSARGEVALPVSGWSAPQIELRWYTPEGSADAVVDGDCPAGFNDSVRRMYLGVSHALEFPLPAAGDGRRTTRLDDYGWIVDVR